MKKGKTYIFCVFVFDGRLFRLNGANPRCAISSSPHLPHSIRHLKKKSIFFFVLQIVGSFLFPSHFVDDFLVQITTKTRRINEEEKKGI